MRTLGQISAVEVAGSVDTNVARRHDHAPFWIFPFQLQSRSREIEE